MNKLSSKIIITLVMVTMMVFLQSNVFATGGQAPGTSGTTYERTVSYFFELIRAMETSTGTLGKTSNINTTNYVDSSANGIDCHLEKNTEYGTITILASSAYGNAISSETASTGANGTGVFQMRPSDGKVEYVANTLQVDNEIKTTSYNKALTSADPRYVDQYVGETKYSIPGDGIIETDVWGGSTNFVTASNPVFYRGGDGFFGYSRNNGVAYTYNGARAVVVCGPGL